MGSSDAGVFLVFTDGAVHLNAKEIPEKKIDPQINKN
jgi:hypothetical protein